MTIPANVSAVITAQNTFTEPLQLDAGDITSISVVGTAFTGTVVLQRKLPGQSAFYDVEDANGVIGWTSKDYQGSYRADERCEVRLGVKTGGFAGTSVDVRLGKG